MLRRILVVLLIIIAVLASGWLMLRRGDIPYDTLEMSYALPESEFITLDDGLKIHYTDTGPRDRSTVVLVHGFSASLHTWNAWRDALDDDFRVITLDLPGHGLSRAEGEDKATIERFAEVVATVTEDLGADRFTIAGNSMGGNTAWMFAITYPDRLDGLALVDASGWPDTGEGRENEPMIFKLLRNPVARMIMKDLDMTSQIRSGLEDSYTDKSFVTDELVERYASLSRGPGHRETLLGIMSKDRTLATPETLAAIQIPTFIIWGRDDNLIPVGDAQRFADAIEGSEVIIYDNIGHIPQEEAAEQSIEDMRAFLGRVEWEAMDVEEIEPAGDPRLVEDRGAE
ncbi:MAG: alpha/beta hydrolase [Pseudomonadota bacterium]